jgi:hypothetical protein
MSSDQSVTATFKPSNHFSFGKLKLDKKNGTATLEVKVQTKGELTLKGKGVKPVKKASGLAKTVKAGKASLKVKPSAKTKKTLATKHEAKVKVKVTFKPKGNGARTEAKKIKLVEKGR